VFHCQRVGLMLNWNRETGFSVVSSSIYPKDLFAKLAWTMPTRRTAGLRSPDGTEPRESKFLVPLEVCDELNKLVKDEDSAVRRISSWPVKRTFVYLDISDFSKFSPTEEALVINSLVNLLQIKALWRTGDSLPLYQAYEALLCIGDGYIFVFKNALVGTRFAALLARHHR